MAKWEYAFDIIPLEPNSTCFHEDGLLSEGLELLSLRGEEGWEVISIIPLKGRDTLISGTVLYKREKREWE